MKQVRLTPILPCLLVVFCAVAGAQTAPLSPLQSVYELLRSHQFAEAEAQASSALQTSPGDCRLSMLLGLALRGEGKTDAALAAFKEANRSCPDQISSLAGEAEIESARGMPEAEQTLRRIVALRPQDATARALLATAEARKGDCAAALPDFAAALPGLPRPGATIRGEAGCLVALGRAPEAVSLLRPFAASEATTQNRVALARALDAAGDKTEALATLQPDTGPDAKDAGALLLAAQLAEAANQTQKAVPWLRQAIALEPGRLASYLYFAELCFNHGSYQVGVDLLNVGLTQRPGNARLLLARGVLEVQLGSMEPALADFEAAHRADPKLGLAEDAIGILFSQKHDLRSAQALFEQRSKEHPDDAMVQYLYAESLSEGEPDDAQTRRAITAARSAIRLEPSYQPARDLLCVLLQRHGDSAEALDVATEAIRRDPADETALYQAMLAERRLKHPERVQALVQQLQVARSHHQAALTKYALEEPDAAKTQP